MIRESLLLALKNRLSVGDIGHCLRVEALAASIAAAQGLDVKRTSLAALAHDFARSLPIEDMGHEAHRLGISVGLIEHAEPYLLHAAIGAALLREELGIDDDEVLSAVASHTMGRPGMGGMEAAVFVADHAEEGRRSEWGEEVRDLAHVDLQGAALLCFGHIIAGVVEKRRPLHVRSVESYNHLLMHRDSPRPRII